ncbi:hypothetical protein [Arcticibacterium luteifluviistationis]|uniref:Uncharacterized protein n=1 Tax=Arcticibacterium luteifluviistationis TaxID=1784714 RepID=A0A2Z4GA03_9BACT|nr:hypothetical protein [Arcticibacterium luteifluviistationis]AWV97888.1 hypothetical protein DJ013_06790 [Arcticibacterium luteifluviistationis]
MTYKWNSTDVETYAKAFSSLICDEYFKNQKTISGGDILKITEIKQLNLLVIRNLFEKWQEESSRLKSPYFDFENEDVKTALATFMNTLSRFISVSRDKFEGLLSKSVQDTLQLALEPKGYFDNLMRNLPEFKLTGEWITANKKYFQINKPILDALENKLNGGSVFANQGIDWLKDIFENFNGEDPSEVLEDFDGILKLNLGKSSVNKSFFDEALEAAPLPTRRTLQPTQEKPEIAAQVRQVVEPTPIPTPSPVTVQRVETVAPPQTIKTAKKEPMSLNDRLLNGNKTLNDSKESAKVANLLDSHSKSKINSLKSGVSLNQRFLFINNLFASNQDNYNRSMETLDACGSLTEAMNYTNHELAIKYQWDSNSAEAEEFYALIERKFN